MSKKVTLIPIAMVRPTKEFIYAPSRIRPSVEVDQETFISQYSDHGKAIPVSFESDGVSNPILTTTYARITSTDLNTFGYFIEK